MATQSSITYSITQQSDCNNTASGFISLNVTTENGPVYVQWIEPSLGTDNLGNGGTSIRENLTDGQYIVSISDKVENLEFIITLESVTPDITISRIQNTTCGNDNGLFIFTLNDGYFPYNVTIYKNGQVYIDDIFYNQENVINNLGSGLYNLVVSGENICTITTDTFQIGASTDIDFGLWVVDDAGCFDTPSGKLTVTGTTGVPPYTVTCSNGSEGSPITGLSAGSYVVTVTDSNGCSLSKNATIGTADDLQITIDRIINPGCFTDDGLIQINIIGGQGPYNVTTDTGFSEITYGNNFAITNQFSGPINITVTDSALCEANIQEYLVAENGFNSATISVTNSTCQQDGGSIDIVVDGGFGAYTYTLIGEGGDNTTVTTNSPQHTFNNLSSGTYTCVVSNNGCDYSEELFVIAEEKFTVNASIINETCGNKNGAINVVLNGDYELPLSVVLNKNGQVQQQLFDVNTNTFSFTNLSNGLYSVVVTDNGGCSITENYSVTSSGNVDFLIDTQLNSGGDAYNLTPLITMGNGPFTYLWTYDSGTSTTQTLTNFNESYATLTITSSSGCVKSRTVNLDVIENFVCYETYVMCQSNFEVNYSNVRDLQGMYNEGFYDISNDLGSNCEIVTGEFITVITVDGVEYEDSFYTSTSLDDVPDTSLYVQSISDILDGISGVGSYEFDLENNKVSVYTDCENDDNALNGSIMCVKLTINYDIECNAPIIVTPSVTPTPSLTPTMTPTPSVTPTMSATPTPSPSSPPEPAINYYFSTKCCEPFGVAVMNTSQEGTFIADDGECYQTISPTSGPADVIAQTEIDDCGQCDCVTCFTHTVVFEGPVTDACTDISSQTTVTSNCETLSAGCRIYKDLQCEVPSGISGIFRIYGSPINTNVFEVVTEDGVIDNYTCPGAPNPTPEPPNPFDPNPDVTSTPTPQPVCTPRQVYFSFNSLDVCSANAPQTTVYSYENLTSGVQIYSDSACTTGFNNGFFVSPVTITPSGYIYQVIDSSGTLTFSPC